MKLTYPQLLQLIGTHNIKTFGELAEYDINEIDSGLSEIWYDAWDIDKEGSEDMNRDFKWLLDKIKDEYPNLQIVKQNLDKFKATITALGFDRRGQYGRDSGIYITTKRNEGDKVIEISEYEPVSDTMMVRDLTGKDAWGQRNQVKPMAMTTEKLVDYMNNYQISFPEEEKEVNENYTKTIINNIIAETINKNVRQ